MRILISYHNFVRDYRGSLLLRAVLKALGHKVWLTPHWYNDKQAAMIHEVDAIVGCQVAEKSTSYLADFSRSNGIHLVLNSSEQFTTSNNVRTLVTYDCDQVNESRIAFQTIACQQLFRYIQQEDEIVEKKKYRFIGFPRYDLAVNPYLRTAESSLLRDQYSISKDSRVFLYLSSFLFDETFADVPAEDMARYNYQALLDRNKAMSRVVCKTIDDFAASHLRPTDVILIKKHPWDPSNKLRDLIRFDNVRFLNANEYIVPCMDISDFVLHSFSTAAVEAWVMGKPTISIMPPEFSDDLSLSHMKHEISVSDSKQLAMAVDSYPLDGPASKADSFLCGLADGKATIRLARMIDELKPVESRNKVWTNRISVRDRIKRRIYDLGFANPTLPNPNLKMKLLVDWEKDRVRIKQIYRPLIKQYLRHHLPSLT